MQRFDPAFYSRNFGIVAPMVRGLLERQDYAQARAALAQDAQPSMITSANAGVPAYLTNYMDPELIRVLTTPNKAAQIMGGEARKGDWTTLTTQFEIVESTGEVTSYGDWNEGGSTGVNVNWEDRQSYLFQTMTQWGERQLDMAGLARVNLAAELNTASAIVIDKFMNNSYFYGLAGLKLYGLLNDPSLQASITPSTKTAGGTTWANGKADEIFTDAQMLYAQIVTQTRGLVDRETPAVLAMSPQAEANLVKTNQYNVNVSDQLKKNFPNWRIETAVQYATAGGGLVQLIVDNFGGQKTAYAAFNEKMRAHAVVTHSSAWHQKKTAGTWGAIIRQPLAIASMLGV